MEKWRRNLYTVWFTQFLSLLGFGFGLPFIPYYIQELGVTDPEALKLWTGWLTSSPALALAIMAPVWGLLADRLGKKLMLIRAMAGGTLVLAGLGFVNSAQGVLILRIVQGLFTGTVTSSAALVASGTPDKKLSYALGFVSSSTFIGWSLGPAVGGLVAEHFGYRPSFLIGSGIMFAGLLLVLLLIQEPTPEMAGRLSATPEKNYTEGRKTGKSETRGLKLLTPLLFLLFFLFFFIRLSRVLPTPFLPLLVQEMRGTIEGSARITGLISGGVALAAAVSGLTLARLGDRMDRLKLLSLLIGAGAFTSALIPAFSGFTIIVISQLLTYFFIGGVEPLLMSITSEQVNSESRGFLFGIQTAVGSAAWFFSPLIGSRISVAYGTPAIFALFPVLLGFTTILSIAVRRAAKHAVQAPPS
ncbi:MAG: MFS transporter [Spirochaetales bacterium]|uniref:MFS transporter n=1 Tax=Candidatus Thalassospirochaeta sargassi TaxID=3119039 RepID=A0AAJ1MJA1_9SPIO|nr:MFS transporter [Spirochaetales bacterium]